jgi:hypothetical protein
MYNLRLQRPIGESLANDLFLGVHQLRRGALSARRGPVVPSSAVRPHGKRMYVPLILEIPTP